MLRVILIAIIFLGAFSTQAFSSPQKTVERAVLQSIRALVEPSLPGPVRLQLAILEAIISNAKPLTLPAPLVGYVNGMQQYGVVGLPQGYWPDAVLLPEAMPQLAAAFAETSGAGIDVYVHPLAVHKAWGQELFKVQIHDIASATQLPDFIKARRSEIPRFARAYVPSEAAPAAVFAAASTGRLRRIVIGSVPPGQGGQIRMPDDLARPLAAVLREGVVSLRPAYARDPEFLRGIMLASSFGGGGLCAPSWDAEPGLRLNVAYERVVRSHGKIADGFSPSISCQEDAKRSEERARELKRSSIDAAGFSLDQPPKVALVDFEQELNRPRAVFQALAGPPQIHVFYPPPGKVVGLNMPDLGSVHVVGQALDYLPHSLSIKAFVGSGARIRTNLDLRTLHTLQGQGTALFSLKVPLDDQRKDVKTLSVTAQSAAGLEASAAMPVHLVGFKFPSNRGYANPESAVSVLVNKKQIDSLRLFLPLIEPGQTPASEGYRFTSGDIIELVNLDGTSNGDVELHLDGNQLPSSRTGYWRVPRAGTGVFHLKAWAVGKSFIPLRGQVSATYLRRWRVEWMPGRTDDHDARDFWAGVRLLKEGDREIGGKGPDILAVLPASQMRLSGTVSVRLLLEDENPIDPLWMGHRWELSPEKGAIPRKVPDIILPNGRKDHVSFDIGSELSAGRGHPMFFQPYGRLGIEVEGKARLAVYPLASAPEEVKSYDGPKLLTSFYTVVGEGLENRAQVTMTFTRVEAQKAGGKIVMIRVGPGKSMWQIVAEAQPGQFYAKGSVSDLRGYFALAVINEKAVQND
jgi:hypothetical protein